MIKSTKHTYRGMNQDISKSKLPNEFYFEGKNIRIIATNSQSTGSVTNEKGNKLIVSIPTPSINASTLSINYTVNNVLKSLVYKTDSAIQPRNEIEKEYFISNNNYKISGDQIIIGHALIRDNIVLFTTDNNGFDCIWKIDDNTYDITLLYMRNLGFNVLNPIQTINNYENEIIDKVYWVDGKHQTRFINIHQNTNNQDIENLIDLSFNNIQIVGSFDLDQPEVIDTIQGGIHTSGMIQYAYNLYRINSSQTKISPLTELIPLNKGDNNGGGELNEVVGTIPIIKIDNLDSTYTNLRLYAIKYTSYNQLPQVSLILDRDISTVNEIIYYDDGNIIEGLSLEEFLFLGSDIIIPKHINTKNNIMFFANYKEQSFDIDTYGKNISLDTRAYSFPVSSTSTRIYNSLYETNTGSIESLEPFITIGPSNINTNIPVIDYKFSSINKDYDINNRQFNSTNVGGEGAFLKYKVVRNVVGVNNFTQDQADRKFLKDNEIYRLGIQFYNKYGQNSLPKWIADFKNIVIDEQSNLNGFYASVELTLKSSFYVWLNTQSNFLDENGIYDETLKPVGYRLLRAERTLLDRTIICQGLLNGMLSQVVGDTSGDDVTSNQIPKVNGGLKIPSMMRRFDNFFQPMWLMESYLRVDRFNEYHPEYQPGSALLNDAANEVFKAASASQWSVGTYQFNKLMQMYSPEITFNAIQTLAQSKLNVIGAIQSDYNAIWNQVRSIETKLVKAEAKTFNAISPHDKKAHLPGNYQQLVGGRNELQFHGFFGHGQYENGPDMNFMQTYRRYTGTYYKALAEETVYGVPEISSLAQGRQMYNNDSDMYYQNSLEPLSADLFLNTVNSWGAPAITFALGGNSIETANRKGLEDLFNQSGIVDTSAAMIAEFRIPRNLVYLGNIYGGNTYESKKRSNYIEIGEYKPITTNIYNCINAGDTFISNFKFTKIVKTETEIYNINTNQLTEIVEFRVETSIDLKNRNDLSIQSWDNRFQPTNNEFQEYNTVYSQDSNLIIRRDTDYKFRRINSFDTNVISSKVKVPGEIIDSWTDLQPNNIITLDGRYGPINSLHNFKDEIYTLQDTATAFLSIQPRVQTQGSDGISVELGIGAVLAEYKYLSTESGTLNKWSVINSPSSFYFYDTLNKSLNIVKGGIGGLSDIKGLHTYFTNNTVLDDLKIDNPIIKLGVTSGFDYINNDMFMTFLQKNKSFTLAYNEGSETFTSFYDYLPSRYISKGNNFITTNPTNKQLYKQYSGDYNNFYGINYPSKIRVLVNPEADLDCVFNNIEYKSEVYINDIDLPASTLTSVRLWNEYQDSQVIPLVVNSNLSRKFRTWRATLPRQKNSMDRIRNPWVFLELEFNNTNNKKLILHDVIVYYTT